jgi:hypothetical protein
MTIFQPFAVLANLEGSTGLMRLTMHVKDGMDRRPMVRIRLLLACPVPVCSFSPPFLRFG